MRSEIVSVVINQPFDEVYRFLADAMNFPSWGPVADAEIHHVGGSDWLVEMKAGPHILRFVPPNIYGVLDYWLFPEGGSPGAPFELRLMNNGDACRLVILWLQRPGTSDSDYPSQIEGVAFYFAKLKALLELDPAP